LAKKAAAPSCRSSESKIRWRPHLTHSGRRHRDETRTAAAAIGCRHAGGGAMVAAQTRAILEFLGFGDAR
jgi:hypothetical protein